MSYPNRKKENSLFKKGFTLIAGIDEVGKGALAGPLIAGVVVFKPKIKISGIKDSKLLDPLKRVKLFLKITSLALDWSIGIVNSYEIDKLGILRANLLAFRRALKKLKIKPDFLLIDGPDLGKFKIPHEYIINGDYKIFSIACASIIAKVIRDELLINLHQEFPEYHFHYHKGYGTRKHFSILEKLGPSPYHRLSFLKNLSNLTK